MWWQFRPDNHAMNFINFNHFHRFHDLNIFPGVHPNPPHGKNHSPSHPHHLDTGSSRRWPMVENLRVELMKHPTWIRWMWHWTWDVVVLNFCQVDSPTIWKGLRTMKLGILPSPRKPAGWNMVLEQPVCKILCGRKSSKRLCFGLVLSYIHVIQGIIRLSSIYSILSYYPYTHPTSN